MLANLYDHAPDYIVSHHEKNETANPKLLFLHNCKILYLPPLQNKLCSAMHETNKKL